MSLSEVVGALSVMHRASVLDQPLSVEVLRLQDIFIKRFRKPSGLIHSSPFWAALDFLAAVS